VQKATKAAWVRSVVSLASFAVALTATIVAVSALSARDRISLGQGIALFATVLTLWMVAVTVMWVRWWRHRRRGDLLEHAEGEPVPFT
jgi:high-affinity Fe2+/Pb2+ permease